MHNCSSATRLLIYRLLCMGSLQLRYASHEAVCPRASIKYGRTEASEPAPVLLIGPPPALKYECIKAFYYIDQARPLP